MITTDMRLRAAFSGGERIEHTDPRERLLMLYGVWVKCLPHQAGRRRLVEQAIARCKTEIELRTAARVYASGTVRVGQ